MTDVQQSESAATWNSEGVRRTNEEGGLELEESVLLLKLHRAGAVEATKHIGKQAPR